MEGSKMIFNGKVTVVDKEKGIVIVTNGEDVPVGSEVYIESKK